MNGKKFNLLYVPEKHNGKPNKATILYQITQPSEGFGNSASGDSFAGFRANKLDEAGNDTGETRSFKWSRVVSMSPI